MSEAEALARAYESGLGADPERRRRGAFYTPPELVDWILERGLPGSSGESGVRVLDPSCGTGHFLVAAARRIGDVRAVSGSDLDPEAVRIARLRLAELDPTVPSAEIAARVRVADGLSAWAGERFDAVVGNPPFLGQMRRRTAGTTGGLGPYTDTSAAFLHAGLHLVDDGGVVALVQPLSVLAARDAGVVRAAVAEVGAVIDFWCSDRPVFADTAVLTCVPVIRRGATGGVRPDDWGALAANTFGLPPVRLDPARRTVADLATCTADFRDQYYGLVPHVRDAGDAGPRAGEVPLITSGLIDPAECRWGRTGTRFARQRYDAPVVDPARLEAKLADWARARLAPKVLVAGQGRVIEAVVDEAGGWLPSVPVLSVLPRSADDPQQLWRILAALLAPPVVAHAASRYLGAGLTPGSVKLSARQLADLPLPGTDGAAAWAEGAVLARRAQQAAPADRPRLLAACGRAMTRAHGLDPDGDGADVLAWWTDRVGRRP